MNSQAGRQDPRLERAGPPRRGIASRPVMLGAFALSAVAHAFFILVYPSLFPRFDPSNATFMPASGRPVPDGIEVMRIIEIDVTEEVVPPDAPELAPVTVREVAVGAPRTVGAPVVDLSRPGITAAERLRPNLQDRRLWAPLPREFTELTLQQREELALSGRLAEWYDSVSAAAAAEAAWTDWTFTDGSGKRWGISDGQLHLGDLTLPLPAFAAAPGAARERAWQWDEISRQGAQMAIQQTVRERMEAIRARRDRERAAERADSTQGRP